MMTFDTTGLIEIKMKRRNGWQGSYFLKPEDSEICVAKTCSLCHKTLPANMFRLSNAEKFKLSNRCQYCIRTSCTENYNMPSTIGPGTSGAEQKRLLRLLNNSRTDDQVLEDRLKKRPTGKKRCKLCHIVKPLSDYGSDRGLGDGLQTLCKTCKSTQNAYRYSKSYVSYWVSNNIPLECYLCAGPFEDIEHLIPTSLGGGYGPANTRPSCYKCNRGVKGKHDLPLEVYIFHTNHPTKTRAQVLHEIVMTGTWPFSRTTPEEFLKEFDNYSNTTINP